MASAGRAAPAPAADRPTPPSPPRTCVYCGLDSGEFDEHEACVEDSCRYAVSDEDGELIGVTSDYDAALELAGERGEIES